MVQISTKPRKIVKTNRATEFYFQAEGNSNLQVIFHEDQQHKQLTLHLFLLKLHYACRLGQLRFVSWRSTDSFRPKTIYVRSSSGVQAPGGGLKSAVSGTRYIPSQAAASRRVYGILYCCVVVVLLLT